MDRATVILLAGVWAFLAAPNLCALGMLMHACEQHASERGHENDCAEDPCGKLVSAGVVSLRATSLDSARQPPFISLFDTVFDCTLPTGHLVSEPDPPRRLACSPGSCLPLLI